MSLKKSSKPLYFAERFNFAVIKGNVETPNKLKESIIIKPGTPVFVGRDEDRCELFLGSSLVEPIHCIVGRDEETNKNFCGGKGGKII